MIELLEKLTQITAPSGNENHIHDFIINEIKEYVDEIDIDALGNLIAHKKGNGKKLMFASHTDEIGIVITYIEDNGMLRFTTLGGVSAHYALYQRVKFTGGTYGVVSFENKDEETLKNLKTSDLYIDIGAKSKKEAEKTVSLGEAACFMGEFLVCGENVISKALDDRAGCTALINAIKSFKEHKNDLYFVFTASEELGLRGAKVAANRINPDFAIAIDVTRTGDVPGKLKMAVSLGDGAAIKIKDSSFIAHPIVKNKMIEVCEKNNIKYQLEVLEAGGTDSGAIQLSGSGVPSGCISIPTRYIHSPSEMINLNDLKCVSDLATKIIEAGF
ncbi:MAG: M42 family metallopeptidase [Clostridia bacterium]|nr:M42 family metallopeptidase [Clostridia bacterium]MBR6646033.1 M42 family metallopeptidase [Clostridia bacterium]